MRTAASIASKHAKKASGKKFNYTDSWVVKAMKEYAKAACKEQKEKCAGFIDITSKKSKATQKRLTHAFQSLIRMTPTPNLK